jgi:membrane protein DedA with SNARE-associated domain
MAMESTILPVPSELVIPPAAFWAAQTQLSGGATGQMSFYGVILAGTLGSYFGSVVSYFIFQRVGKKLIDFSEKYLFVKKDKMKMVENIVTSHGALGVFFARLLPVVRHLISIPAGIFKMSFKKFSLATLTGSFFWCCVLAVWGEKIIGKHPELLNSPEEMMHVIRSELMGFVLTIFVFAALYGFVLWMKKRSKLGAT